MARFAGGLVDIADVADDTDWQPITLASGFAAVSGYTPEVRRQGIVVWVRGRATYSGTWTNPHTVGTLPSGFSLAPANIVEGGPVMYGTSSNTGRLYCTPTGEIQIFGGATIAATAFYLSTLGWMVDL